MDPATDSISQAIDQTATPTKFNFGSKPGELNIDASGTNVLFPLPTQVRNFSDWHAFTSFAVANLNAQIIYTNNAPSGVYISLRQDGQPYYADQSAKTAVPIWNAVAAYLGGLAGYFTVGGQRIDVRDPNSSDPFNANRVCAPSRTTFCLNGLTSLTHLAFYHNVGTDSSDSSTGADAPHTVVHFVASFPFLSVASTSATKTTSVSATWTGPSVPTRAASMSSSLLSSFVTVTDTEVSFFGCGHVCGITHNAGVHGLTDLSPAGTTVFFNTAQ